jgi:tetratricopeptide (TPR) repeat protein
MSLLIDALKRAERAKNGQTEPVIDSRNTVERAVDSAATSLDWSLTEPSVDPVVSAADLDIPETPARSEPKFSGSVGQVPLREPTVSKPVSPTIPAKSWNTSKPDRTAAAQEREAVQTLFDAKRPVTRSRAGMFALLGLAALILAGGGFYVWYSLAFPPSPAFQAVQSRSVMPTPTAEPRAAPIPPSPNATVAKNASISTAPPEAISEPAPIAVANDMAKANKLLSELIPATKRKTPQRDATTNVENESSSDEMVRREINQARRSQINRRNKPARTSTEINVDRSASTGFDADIALAYNSLLSGDRAEAKRLYAIAAERDPFNTDALLGLATIAGNQGDLTGAERYYRRAIEIDPQNAAAIAGLASIRQTGGPSESQLKFELARAPDSAPLQFALGNQFANQGRWDEAQQAYFDAFSLDARNADYAYNLAVSLDQLNQAKQATIYYKKALELAKVRSARFRSADINARLIELGQAQ